jgi:DNA-binding MarR family transcriptional regulator
MARAGTDDEAACADRLQASAVRVLHLLRRMDRETGVNASRLGVLSHVAHEGPATIGELARTQHVRSPSMTEVVADLEAEGLIRREADPRDGRRVRVAATAAGRRRLEEWRARRIRPLAALLQALPARKTEGIDRSFALVEKVLEDALRQAPRRARTRRGPRASARAMGRGGSARTEG